MVKQRASVDGNAWAVCRNDALPTISKPMAAKKRPIATHWAGDSGALCVLHLVWLSLQAPSTHAHT